MRTEEQAISALKDCAVEYYSVCAELVKIKGELLDIYKFPDYDWNGNQVGDESQVFKDVESLYEERKKAIVRTQHTGEFSHRECPLNWYDEKIHKTDFDTLSHCFKLYKRRKEIKRRKGYLKRRLYDAGKTLFIYGLSDK